MGQGDLITTLELTEPCDGIRKRGHQQSFIEVVRLRVECLDLQYACSATGLATNPTNTRIAVEQRQAGVAVSTRCGGQITFDLVVLLEVSRSR